MKLKRKKSPKKQAKRRAASFAGNGPAGDSQLLKQGRELFRQGRLKQAAAVLQRFLQVNADHAEANHIYGLIVHQLSPGPEAAGYLVRAIKADPRNPYYCNSLGSVLQQQRNFPAALEAFNQALALKPDYAEPHYRIACMFFEVENYETAIEACRNALKIDPQMLPALLLLAELYNFVQRHDEAIALCRQVVERNPDYPAARHLLADLLAQGGQIGAAAEECRALIQKFPRDTQAHHLLSLLRKHSSEDLPEVEAMEKLYRTDLNVFDKVHLAFALGKAYEDLGRYPEAFALIREGNRLHRSCYSYDIRNEQKFFSSLVEVFDRDFIKAHSADGCRESGAIFIVGMPRSGTSLVEQILASHPRVFGAGEQLTLHKIIQNHSAGKTGGAYPLWLEQGGADELAAMGSEYLAEIRRFSAKHEFITNKMPMNFLHIGLIKAILPRAKVIHCERDPMAVCWSMYKNMLKSSGYPFSYDLEEIGKYYGQYRRLMQYWSSVLPDFVYGISYEQLVAGQEEETRRLLDYCGLEFDSACLAFHKSKRAVSTVSFVQANQPIYSSSVALWRNYEEQLASLQKILSS